MTKPQSAEEFWRGYEEKTGEKVLASMLGRYIDGWADFDDVRKVKQGKLWGLLIATDAHFRFHHFPHESWLEALGRISGNWEAPQEHTFAIPRAQVKSVALPPPPSLLKRIFTPFAPILSVAIDNGFTATTLRFEVLENNRDKFIAALEMKEETR